jgi:hypothetical protein
LQQRADPVVYQRADKAVPRTWPER